MEYFLEFKPLIKNAYAQTIMGTAIDFELELKSKTHYVKLPDGDLMAVEISTPKHWKEELGCVLMVHGLCGSHKSQYMKRLAKRFFKNGVQVARINLRGCGSGKGHARGIYHSGCSQDVLEVVKDIKHHFPDAPLVLMGFSLGANVSLKLAGELKDQGKELLKGVIAIGPPVDLFSSARLFAEPKNQIYAKYFLRLLLNDVYYVHSRFKDLPPHNLPPDITLGDFDELYVAPRANFRNAIEYYHHSSSKRVIQDIAIPTKILLALDDPIISPKSLDQIKLPANIDLYKTEYGGHIGFMGLNIFKEFHWMDNLVVDWVNDYLQK